MKICDVENCNKPANKYVSFGLFSVQFDLCEKHHEEVRVSVSSLMRTESVKK